MSICLNWDIIKLARKMYFQANILSKILYFPDLYYSITKLLVDSKIRNHLIIENYIKHSY